MRSLLWWTAQAGLRGALPDLVRFDYGQHGQDWVQGQCASRNRQSPIDVPRAVLAELSSGTLPVRYQAESEFLLVNNGHVIHVDMESEGLGGLTFENVWFNLLAVNLHAEGEHTYGGERPPVELHLVHKRWDSDALAVLAIPFEPVEPPVTNMTNATDAIPLLPDPYVPPDPAGLGYNALLEVFTSAVPGVGEEASVAVPWDLNALVAGAYISYDGSLTAPPCSENVRWFVRQQPLQASMEQVEILRAATYRMNPQGNWRTPFPLGDRKLTIVQTVADEPALTAPGKVAGPSSAMTRPEKAALDWVADAAKQAMHSLQHMKNLDQRLRKAAVAHSDAQQAALPGWMGPPPPAPLGPSPAEIANGIVDSLHQAVDTSVGDLTARINPLAAARQHGRDLSTTLNNGQLTGMQHLDAAGIR